MIPDGFLRAIVESPSDNTPRLIFADWLEEHGGQERCDFIRIQIRLDEIRPGPDEYAKASRMLTRYNKGAPIPLKANTPAVLLVREAILLQQFALAQDWPQIPERFIQWEWTRGFVSGISLLANDWLYRGPQLVQTHPLERVTLTDLTPEEKNHHMDFRWGFDWEKLNLFRDGHFNEMFHLGWQTEQMALDCQIRCCLAWARAKAGLPALPFAIKPG